MTWDKFLSPESNLFNWGSFLEFWLAFPKGGSCRAWRSRCGGEGEGEEGPVAQGTAAGQVL